VGDASTGDAQNPSVGGPRRDSDRDGAVEGGNGDDGAEGGLGEGDRYADSHVLAAAPEERVCGDPDDGVDGGGATGRLEAESAAVLDSGWHPYGELARCRGRAPAGTGAAVTWLVVTGAVTT
jgi:hypothetical protein